MLHLHRDFAHLPTPSIGCVRVESGPAVKLFDREGRLLVTIDIQETLSTENLNTPSIQKYLIVLGRCEPLSYKDYTGDIKVLWMGDAVSKVPAYVGGLLAKAVKHGVKGKGAS